VFLSPLSENAILGCFGGEGGVPPLPPQHHKMASKGDFCHSKWSFGAKKRAFDIGGVRNTHPAPASNGSLKLLNIHSFSLTIICFEHEIFEYISIKESSKPRTGGSGWVFLSPLSENAILGCFGGEGG